MFVYLFGILEGDVNGDGFVDAADYTVVTDLSGRYDERADRNDDGVADNEDRILLSATMGARCPLPPRGARAPGPCPDSAAVLRTGAAVLGRGTVVIPAARTAVLLA